MNKKLKAEIAADIRKIAESCLDTATDADYYGGNDADMIRVSRALIAGSAALVMLADGMESTQ